MIPVRVTKDIIFYEHNGQFYYDLYHKHENPDGNLEGPFSSLKEAEDVLVQYILLSLEALDKREQELLKKH